MPFETIAGFPGKVYVPEEQPADHKKHHCKDCHNCQMCSDDRCQVCRGIDSPKGKARIACCMPGKRKMDTYPDAGQ